MRIQREHMTQIFHTRLQLTWVVPCISPVCPLSTIQRLIVKMQPESYSVNVTFGCLHLWLLCVFFILMPRGPRLAIVSMFYCSTVLFWEFDDWCFNPIDIWMVRINLKWLISHLLEIFFNFSQENAYLAVLFYLVFIFVIIALNSVISLNNRAWGLQDHLSIPSSFEIIFFKVHVCRFTAESQFALKIYFQSLFCILQHKQEIILVIQW